MRADEYTDAIHEAGHVVAVLDAGYTVDQVSIDVEGKYGLTQSDLVLPEVLTTDQKYVFGWFDAEEHFAVIEAEIINSMAGLVAEAILRGDDDYEPNLEFNEGDLISSDVKQLRNVLRLRYGRNERPAEQARLLSTTRDLLTANWTAIVALADALVAERTLEAERVLAIVARTGSG